MATNQYAPIRNLRLKPLADAVTAPYQLPPPPAPAVLPTMADTATNRIPGDPAWALKSGASLSDGAFTHTAYGDLNNGGVLVTRGNPSTIGSAQALREQGYTPEQATALVAAQGGVAAADAGAKLDNTKSALLPAESAASIGLSAAQARELAARASLADEQSKYVGLTATSEAGLRRAQGGLYGAQGKSLTADLAPAPVLDDSFIGAVRRRLANPGLALP